MKKGLHLFIIDILEKAVGYDDNKLKCRWCETTFTNVGNINKHLNTSKMCNKMAFEEFKKHINHMWQSKYKVYIINYDLFDYNYIYK